MPKSHLSVLKGWALCLGVFLPLALTVQEARAGGNGLFISAAGQYGQMDKNYNIDDADDLKAVFDDNDVGLNAGIGWRFTKWLAVDAGYWDLGTFKSDELQGGGKIDLDTSTYTVGAIVSVPLWIVDVYARGGAAFWQADSNQVDNDGNDLYYGVGVALNIFSSIDLYLEGVRFDLDTNIDTVGLGVRITF